MIIEDSRNKSNMIGPTSGAGTDNQLGTFQAFNIPISIPLHILKQSIITAGILTTVHDLGVTPMSPANDGSIVTYPCTMICYGI
jgi:hypothetical protein